MGGRGDRTAGGRRLVPPLFPRFGRQRPGGADGCAAAARRPRAVPRDRALAGGAGLCRAPDPGGRRGGGVGAARGFRRRDRKSVVWGTSVSVRVDLGGRRNIKKKNKHE